MFAYCISSIGHMQQKMQKCFLSFLRVQVPNLFFADHCVSKTWPPPVLIGYNGQNIVNIKSTINSLLLRALVYFFPQDW